jgi:glycosyltransferase involved in cell wall biosynthesis
LYGVDKIIVANKMIEKQLFELNVKQDNINVISPFLMPVPSSEKELLSKYCNNNIKVILFNAYRLELTKDKRDIYGFDTLIDGFSKINKDVVLILLIPQMDSIEKKYFDDTISILTKKDRERIVLIQDEENEGYQYIKEADIFIRPTITDGDALSVKEALCFGIPAIVSDCTYRPSQAIQFKTGDSYDLSIKVNSLIENYAKEKNKLMNIKFCEDSKGKQFINLYKELGQQK